ncbi:hypothetical protein [Aliivibrio logei]|jgi:hypothetical protein|uniref:hypothetical protein n=1 Tax=Aliivibrio logei TaxID=688 RepID=UPI0035C8CE7C
MNEINLIVLMNAVDNVQNPINWLDPSLTFCVNTLYHPGKVGKLDKNERSVRLFPLDSRAI